MMCHGRNLGVLVVRFDHDLNVIVPRCVDLHVNGRPVVGVRAHMTDYASLYTEFRPVVKAEDTVSFTLEPNAFVYLEFPGNEKKKGEVK